MIATDTSKIKAILGDAREKMPVKEAPAEAFDGLAETVASPKKAKPARKATRPASKQKWLIGGGIGLGVLLLALLGMWASGVFKVKTKDGILLVEVNEPNPDVYVDGERVAVSWSNGGKKAEIRVKPGTRKVEVKKAGFRVDGEELTFKDGDRKIFTARLLPERRVEKTDTPPPEKSSPPPDTKKPDVSDGTGAMDDDRDQSAIRVLQGHAGKVWQVAFSPDGKHLLSGSNSHYGVHDPIKRVNNNYPGSDNTVRLWEVETGRQVTVLRGHTWEVMGLAYCPNDSNLAAACSSTEWATDYADPRVVVYNLKSGAIRNAFRLPPRPAMRGIALSADGKRLIVCRGNSTLEAWDLATKIKQPTVWLEKGGHQNFLWCVTFTADRRRVFGGQGGGAVRLWDAETGKVIQNYLGHTRRIASVALSPDEKKIASTSDDGTVRVWDVESEKELLCLNGHEKGIGATNENEHSVRSVVFSPDGRWILSGGWDGTVRLWDANTGKQLRRYLGHTEGVRGVAISPDGRLAASASDDKTIRLWKLP